jgi:hypothetical protein
MARRRTNFMQRGINFLDELDRITATTIYNGPKQAAERVVREMQQDGPSWTGRFSNSWQIQTPTRLTKGTGAPGEPIPLSTPSLRGREVSTSFGSKNSVVFTISNFSPHALEAIDAVQHDRKYYANRKTAQPTTQLGKSKWKPDGPRSEVSYRGQTGGGNEGSNSSRTAPLDWFARYASAKLDRAIKIEMDSAINRRFS